MGRTPSRDDTDAAARSHGGRRRGWFGLASRHRRNHVVVCGLGPVGTVIVRDWARAGESVVAIAVAPTAAEAEACEAAGAELLVGTPADPVLLDDADVAAARVLVAVCTDEGANVEVVLAAD